MTDVYLHPLVSLGKDRKATAFQNTISKMRVSQLQLGPLEMDRHSYR